jgi:hypothetical protein
VGEPAPAERVARAPKAAGPTPQAATPELPPAPKPAKAPKPRVPKPPPADDEPPLQGDLF